MADDSHEEIRVKKGKKKQWLVVEYHFYVADIDMIWLIAHNLLDYKVSNFLSILLYSLVAHLIYIFSHKCFQTINLHNELMVTMVI